MEAMLDKKSLQRKRCVGWHTPNQTEMDSKETVTMQDYMSC